MFKHDPSSGGNQDRWMGKNTHCMIKNPTLPGLCFVCAISFVSMWLFKKCCSSVNIHSRQSDVCCLPKCLQGSLCSRSYCFSQWKRTFSRKVYLKTKALPVIFRNKPWRFPGTRKLPCKYLNYSVCVWLVAFFFKRLFWCLCLLPDCTFGLTSMVWIHTLLCIKFQMKLDTLSVDLYLTFSKQMHKRKHQKSDHRFPTCFSVTRLISSLIYKHDAKTD